jgi:hypothetical protein
LRQESYAVDGGENMYTFDGLLPYGGTAIQSLTIMRPMPKGKTAQEILGGGTAKAVFGKSFRPRRGRTSFPGRTPGELAVRTFPLAFTFISWLNFELLRKRCGGLSKMAVPGIIQKVYFISQGEKLFKP